MRGKGGNEGLIWGIIGMAIGIVSFSLCLAFRYQSIWIGIMIGTLMMNGIEAIIDRFGKGE